MLASVQHFDSVIVGHSLPQEDKRKLVSAIKELWPRLPVLVIVADPEEKDKIADACVAGSAGPDALTGALRKLMLEHPVRGTVSDHDQDCRHS